MFVFLTLFNIYSKIKCMAKYLKLFNVAASYEAWKASENYILPNVSYTEDGNLFYNPFKNESTSTYTMVDLGLPSGLKWANMNVGATNPEDYGLYFQWGDTVGCTSEQFEYEYNEEGELVIKPGTWDDYCDLQEITTTIEREWDEIDEVWNEREVTKITFKKYAADKLTTLESVDDAASVHMGDGWRMPTYDELVELYENTTPIFVDSFGNEYYSKGAASEGIDGTEATIKGYKLVGPNGNSIFIPILNRYPSQVSWNEIWSSNAGGWLGWENGDNLDQCVNALYFSIRAYRDYEFFSVSSPDGNPIRYTKLNVRGVHE